MSEWELFQSKSYIIVFLLCISAGKQNQEEIHYWIQQTY